ncbi:hypothetical protein E4T46_06606 [Aureobasidium subglaciale]|nr:hypothetical protein E4T40_06800 [Aureobasidium subglaciale]KAI5259854.1 hypothetical protein E4T46_06606 [Aureobasidium subglaciale]
MASTSSTRQQPFTYLFTDSILWCNPSDSLIVKEWLKSQPSAFLPSFLNECVKVINLLHDHWRRKDSGDPTPERWAIWTCLSKWPIDAAELVKLMQGYADGKFRDGVTKTGVVNLKDGDMDDKVYAAAQTTLYQKVFNIGDRETHRKQLERNAGLQPLQRPHPGIQRARDKHQRSTEARKKRRWGDREEEAEDDGLENMRKMKLVFSAKGKGKEKIEEKVKEKDNEE